MDNTSRTTPSITVFCGSSGEVAPVFLQLATDVGKLLAERNIRLVYGGASVEAMGAVANSVLSHGGRVVGVIPQSLKSREIAHQSIQDLRVVDTMHTRKMMMADECHAFIALPGGFGTMDELFEIVTWRQLQLHHKPVALVNVYGFYDPLIEWINRATHAKFVPPHVASVIDIVESVPALEQWIEKHFSGFTDKDVR